ncbi:MAG: SDR family oxidoreductase [Aliidiomarina sp.]|uniref:SDR family oxidoreductase n=1 Tax=Aliidiomarina sp. TaxID=1872439 RepID=UPI0025BB8F4A|nr:SDR family oxidoreductase [Aliidiomarina sp.]MCH8501144.1 SDR family oxidoreductase [Aliidiomarina sp.]
MSNNLSPQKRIFITGGASGFGFALANFYAQQGWRVAIGDIQEELGQQAQQTLAQNAQEVRYFHCDVTDEVDLQRVADTLLEAWGGVDLVVNNAGVAQVGAIETVSLDDWHWIININLLGVVRGCKVFTPIFKQQKQGHFINIASMAGLLDVPNMSAYNSTKAAVVSLSETLQHELAPSNIGVTVVCPSFFRTNLGNSMRSTVPNMDKTLDKLMSKSDLSADDIARQVAAAAAQKHFYVLPHATGRRIWRLKRWLPRGLYARLMQQQFAKVGGKR